MELLRRLTTRQLERNHGDASGCECITQAVGKGTRRIRLGGQHHPRETALRQQGTQRINGDPITYEPAARNGLGVHEWADSSRRGPQEFDCLVGE